MDIYVSHSTQYDFKKELYEPLKNSTVLNKHKIILPHDNSEELYDSKNLFLHGCNYIIAEVSIQSLGVGIELGWANLNNVEIICVYKKGSRFSSALKAVSSIFIEYETESDMIEKLEQMFAKI